MSKKYLLLVVHNVKTEVLSIFQVVGEDNCFFSHTCGSILKYLLPKFLLIIV